MAAIMGTGTMLDEERRKEEERRAREEAERAAREAQKAAEDAAAQANQTAQENAQTVQTNVQPVQAAKKPEETVMAVQQPDVPVTAAPQDDVETQDPGEMYRQDVRGMLDQTKFTVTKYDEVNGYRKDMSLDEFKDMTVSRASGTPIETWTGNNVSIDYRSVKSAEQAYLLVTTGADDKAKAAIAAKCAKQLGINADLFLSQCENYVYDRYGRNVFSTPKSVAAKNRFYTQGVDAIGLMDTNGDVLDMMLATPQDIMRACHMEPSEEKRDTAKKLAKYASKIPGNLWYGMDVTDDMFAFMDSADLTKKEYDEEVSGFDQSFSFSDMDENKAAYLDHYQDILARYGGNRRVFNSMLNALNDSFTVRTGLVPPGEEQVKKALAEIAQQTNADADTEGKEKKPNPFDQFVQWVKTNLLDFPPDDGRRETERKTLDDLITLTEAQENTQDSGQEAGSAGSSSVITKGGTVSVGGQEVTFSPPVASAVMTSGVQMTGGMQEEQDAPQMQVPPGAYKKSEVYGPAEPAGVRMERAEYDPNMTDVQAWMLYQQGYLLDPRNQEQIEAYLKPEIRGILTNEKGGSGTSFETSAGGAAWPVAEMTGYRAYGPEAGKVIGLMKSTSLNGEPLALAQLEFMDIMKGLQDYLSAPYTPERPKGVNGYTWALSQNDELAQRLSALEQQLISATGTHGWLAEEKAQELDARMQTYEQAVMAGTATPGMLEELSRYYAGDFFDVTFDESRNRMSASLYGKNALFAADSDFWTGDSLAANEGRSIRTSGGMQAFTDFGEDMKWRVQDTIDSYTAAANQIGMTLEDYLASAGITDIRQIADIAYNEIRAQGQQILSSPDAIAEVDAAAYGNYELSTWDATKLGAEKGTVDYWEGFCQTSYMVMDLATYEQTRQSIKDEFYGKYGELAPTMYRRALNVVLAGDTLSEEMKTEMRRNIANADNIFDLAYEIDPGILKGAFRYSRAELGKRLETLQAVTDMLTPEQQMYVNFIASGANSVNGMLVNAATMGAGKLVGASAFASRVAGAVFGTGFNAFEDAYDENFHKLGMDREHAAYAAMGDAVFMTASEYLTPDLATDLLFGGQATQKMAQAARKNPLAFWGTVGKSILANGGNEATEEIIQSVGGYYLNVFDSLYLADQNGEKVTTSTVIRTAVDGIRNTDYEALLKDAAGSGVGGFVFGVIFSVAGAAGGMLPGGTTRAALRDGQAYRSYESVQLACGIAEGTVEPTQQNLERLFTLLNEDLKDKSFCAYIDRSSQQATMNRKVMTAMLEGEEADAMERAVDHADKTKTYTEKADAAGEAVSQSQGDYMALRNEVSGGNLDAVPALEAAQQRWAKAQTAYNEAVEAAQKEKNRAGKSAKEWLDACMAKAQAYTAEGMKVTMNRIAAMRMSVAGRIDALYTQMEAAKGEYDAALTSDMRADREVSYAEDAVFAQEPEAIEDAEDIQDAVRSMGIETAVDNVISLQEQMDEAEHPDTRVAATASLSGAVSQAKRILDGMIELAYEAYSKLENMELYDEIAERYNNAVARLREAGIEVDARDLPKAQKPSAEMDMQALLDDMNQAGDDFEAQKAGQAAGQIAVQEAERTREEKAQNEIDLIENAVFAEEPEAIEDTQDTQDTQGADIGIETAVDNVIAIQEQIAEAETADEQVAATPQLAPAVKKVKAILGGILERAHEAFYAIGDTDAYSVIAEQYNSAVKRLREAGIDIRVRELPTAEKIGRGSRVLETEYGRWAKKKKSERDAQRKNEENAVDDSASNLEPRPSPSSLSTDADGKIDVEAYISEKHPNATEDERSRLLEMYEEIVGRHTPDTPDPMLTEDEAAALEAIYGQKTEEKRARLKEEETANKTRERARDIATGTTAQQREAERLQKQESRNILEMDAQDYIETTYPDASEEEKANLRDMYIRIAGEAPTAVNNAAAPVTEQTANTEQPLQEQAGSPASTAYSTDGLRMMARLSSLYGFRTEVVEDSDPRLKGAEGGYERSTNTMYIPKGITQSQALVRVLVHELTHFAESGAKAYDAYQKALLALRYGENKAKQDADVASIIRQYNEYFRANNQTGADGNPRTMDEKGALSELTAKITAEIISGNRDMITRLTQKEPGIARRIADTIRDFINRLRGVKGDGIDQLERVERMFRRALRKAQKANRSAGGMQYSIAGSDTIKSRQSGETLTKSVNGTTMQYSLRSWTDEERETVRNNLINSGYSQNNVDKWIDDVNSVARIIASDRDRLDFTPADNHVMLKPNQEYVKTLDTSTLCAKRLLYQGTFNAVQHAMPDMEITSDGLIMLRNMMAEMGYETPCGICYVESRRRNLGAFARQWLDGYDAKGGYQPKLDDVTTTDGLERMRTEHPEVYKSFVDEMNRKGSNNPKVVQLRTDYRGDIRSLKPRQIEKIVEIGGLRVQSFSDFETPHLLDMMQAVLDMADKGLTSQAYTKVPNFAAVFGDTGIKINLSLIAEGNGLDENGNLIFSSYEGMDFKRAMELRNMYSKNVGTILVGVNDAHIMAAMADPRIDFIIPFHKSGWGQKQLEALTGMRDYLDYTADQNEKRRTGTTKTGKPVYKNVAENFHPVDYWDYEKSGKENAEAYLRMCAEDGRIPKFSRFLTDNGDGSYSLKEDGSTDGYWKLLIDYKMYDNNGVGSPQMPVQPNFNMDEAVRVLDEYEGGADTLPVAQDVVDRFVNEYGKNGSGNASTIQYSISQVNPGSHYDYSKPFAQQVDDYLAGKIPNGDALILGGTPEIYQKIGFSNLPMTINTDHIKDAVLGLRDTEHTMSKYLLSQLPELLSDPIAVIESKNAQGGTQSSVVSIVKAVVNGKPVVAPIYITRSSNHNGQRYDTNTVSTAFRKKNGIRLLTDAINNTKGVGVYYINKTEAQNLYAGSGVQFPRSSLQDGLNHSIFDAGSPVNSNFLEQTQTRQFDRWFRGSKVVDGDGKPLVVYYGSDTGFDGFNMTNGRSDTDIQGAAFSIYEDDAAGYGENVGAFYLSIKNPADKSTADMALNRFKGQDEAGVKAREYLQSLGYDGVYNGYDEYIAFEPTQIKSATDNVGLFDPQNANIQYALPSNDILEQEIRAWMNGREAQLQAANSSDGVSRFASDTVQRVEAVPLRIRQEFAANPILRSYRTDSNADQISRATDRIESAGYQSEVDRLLEAESFNADDNVEAGMIALAAFENGDIRTGLDMALKYRVAGTEQGKALQSRKVLAKMTPTHMGLKIAADMEQRLKAIEKASPDKAKAVNRRAEEAQQALSGLSAVDETQRIASQGGTIDRSNNVQGAIVNEQQKAAIRRYRLERTNRKIDHYNRATLKQRMLEFILDTPDLSADTGNGITGYQRLEWMKEGHAVMTSSDLRHIMAWATEYGMLSDEDQAGRMGDILMGRIAEAYANMTPATAFEKGRTMRFVNMLMSLTSSERNVMGNGLQNVVNDVTHDTLEVGLDKLVSLATGERTKAELTFAERAEGWRAFVEETKNAFRDYFIDEVDTTPRDQGTDKFDSAKRGRVFQLEPFNAAHQIEGFLMSFGDRNFYKRAYVNSINEQIRVAEMNGLEPDMDAIINQARLDADYATFNEDGKLRRGLSYVQNKTGWFGQMFSLYCPFVGVPTNIAKRGFVEYSPLGAAITVGQVIVDAVQGNGFNQRRFVENMARSISGSTMLLGMGFLMAANGMYFPGTGDEEDQNVAALRAAEGQQYSPFIRIGDTYVSLGAFAPAIYPVTIGATIHNILKNGDGDMFEAAKNAMIAISNQFFDSTFMSGLTDIFNTQNSTVPENIIATLPKTAVNQMVPFGALLSQVATGLDTYARDTKDKDIILRAMKDAAARIPYLREQVLDVKTDITGRPVESKPGVINNLINPLTTTQAVDDPVLEELDRLYDTLGTSAHIPSSLIKTSGKVTILAKVADNRHVDMDRKKGEHNLVLTAAQRNQYNRLYASLCFDGTVGGRYVRMTGVDTRFSGIRELTQSRSYQRADDEEKAKMISEIISKAKTLTHAQMVSDLGYIK